MPAVIQRWPRDDDELHAFVGAVWDFDIPRVKVCPNHCAPFDAFANAYFARSPVSVWKASRGLGGKSTLLGVLSITEALTLAAQVTVLGGSAAQSQRVHDVTKEAWHGDLAPLNMLEKSTMFDTFLTNQGHIRALLASQTSVRGPHPQRLRLDEIDEMELAILEAAQGQPMEKMIHGELVDTQTVMSSTHQYPDATMTKILKRAALQGWPIFEWCYKESAGTKLEPGWLSQRMIERKRQEVTHEMWRVEFDLQEPSFEGRAIDVKKVEYCFNVNLGHETGDLGENYIFEAFDPAVGNRYATGIDWAKEKDWTIIATFRADIAPWRCVAWRRLGRMSWPVMVGLANDRLAMYGGWVAHDNTGLGDVVADLLEFDDMQRVDVTLSGATRSSIFMEYIKAIESAELQYPRIDFAYNEHKYVTLDDLYGSGHPPDSFVAGALAWSLRMQVLQALAVGPGGSTRDESPWRST